MVISIYLKIFMIFRYVYGVDMFICGSYSMNHFHDCAEVHYFLCGDRINDVLCLPVVEGSWVGRGITPVLACDDRTLKILKGSTVDYIIEVGGAPTVIHLYQNTGGELQLSHCIDNS